MSLTLDFAPGVVIVAGGSGGIGECIARSFARARQPVAITFHRNQARALAIRDEIVAAGGRCDCFQVDLADAAQVESLFAQVRAQHERIAGAVYAAGPHFDFNFIGQIPDQQWHQVVNADINGAFHFIQSSVRAFRAQGGGGNLVAITTCAVERFPIADAMSAAPKAAIEMLIRGVAKESGRFGIRANCVGPGWINAGLGKKSMQEKLDPKTLETMRTKAIPLQRFGEGDDIANAVLFLCSQQAGYISGQSLAIDGGLQL